VKTLGIVHLGDRSIGMAKNSSLTAFASLDSI